MSDPEEKKRSFIKEHIVPRKQYKKILTMSLTALLLGLLFGAMAGISFYTSQGILKDHNAEEAKSETIVIARDQEPEPSTEEVPEEPEKPEDTAEPESSSEPEEPSESEETGGEDTPENTKDTEVPGNAADVDAEPDDSETQEDAGRNASEEAEEPGDAGALPEDEDGSTGKSGDTEAGDDGDKEAENTGDSEAGDTEAGKSDGIAVNDGDEAGQSGDDTGDGSDEAAHNEPGDHKAGDAPDDASEGADPAGYTGDRETDDVEAPEEEADAGKDGEDESGPDESEGSPEPAEDRESGDEEPEDTETEGGESGEPEGPEDAEADDGQEEPESEGEENEDVHAALSLREMYDSVSAGFVTVTIKDSAGTDLFGKPVTSRRDQFGVIMFESEEYLYILTDGTGIRYSTEVTMTHAGRKVPVEISEQDSLTSLMVLRAKKADFKKEYTVIPLGNSFLVKAADYVFMAGSPDGDPGAVDYGVVTYVNSMDEVTDGYRQLFTTNMQRSEGGSAVLFNQNCEIIGWVSDYSCGDSERVHAAGISPLKYVLEDLCSGESTAYLGVRCLTVNMEKAEETGLPTGLYVTEVDENSPAYMMGIQAGDRIISINDKDINDSRTLQNVLDELTSGKETVLMIERQGKAGDEPLKVVLFVGKR